MPGDGFFWPVCVVFFLPVIIRGLCLCLLILLLLLLLLFPF